MENLQQEKGITGILKAVDIVDGLNNTKQVKFTISPTSYSGKDRFEWYSIPAIKSAIPNSKYGQLVASLVKLDFYDVENNIIMKDKIIGKEFEWKYNNRNPSWSAIRCKDCMFTATTTIEAFGHNKNTGHKINSGSYLTPTRMIK